MIFKTGQLHNPLQIQIHHTLPLILLIKPESVPDSYLGSVNHTASHTLLPTLTLSCEDWRDWKWIYLQ